ncbi:MAG: hypothetical protein C0615_06560 [Desulfuromonas sp.]|nr:MAG: hypothetical protein C0615_06560 [Desulfuromonas sp.]
MAEIHIFLMYEGPNSWRPVQSHHVREDQYLIPQKTVVPEGEHWKFKPGETVRCQKRLLSEKECLVAICRVSPETENWSYQLASDIDRDTMNLELLNSDGDIVAVISRCDEDNTVSLTTFKNEIPLDVFKRFYDNALTALDPCEDGTTFESLGLL